MRTWGWLVTLLLMGTLLVACGAASENEQIAAAARAVVQPSSQDRNQRVDVTVDAVEGEFARATLLPAGKDEQPTFLFLRKRDGRWQPIAIGTSFPPNQLDALQIPSSVRGPF